MLGAAEKVEEETGGKGKSKKDIGEGRGYGGIRMQSQCKDGGDGVGVVLCVDWTARR